MIPLSKNPSNMIPYPILPRHRRIHTACGNSRLQATVSKLLALAACAIAVATLHAQEPPATFSRDITNGSTTLTVDFTLHPIRSTNFNVQVQDASGGFTTYTAGFARTYLGTVANRPGALAAGYLRDDGTALYSIIFEDGVTWNGSGTTAWTAGSGDWSPSNFPSSGVGAGGAGSNVYAAELGVDASYREYLAAGSSTEGVLEIVEFSVMKVNAVYLRDAAILHRIGRVIIRTSQAHCPYESNADWSTLLGEMRNQWNNVLPASAHDVALMVKPQVGGGLAYVGVIGSSSRYSINGAEGNGDFSKVWRHEVGHNWGSSHYEGGGKPEGPTIMSDNQISRISTPELAKIINHRNSKAWALDDLGSYSFPIPPRAMGDRVSSLSMAPTLIDVLANDSDSNGQALTLLSFDSTSAQGGTITRSVGTGPGGRDQLQFIPTDNNYSFDHFNYRIQDSAGKEGLAKVYLTVPVAPGTYRLTPVVAAGSALNVPNSSSANGTQLTISTSNGGGNQMFDVVDVGGGYFKLRCVHDPSKCVDVDAASSANGARIQIWDDNGGPAQKWKLVGLGDGNYKLQPQCAQGSCLDNASASAADGNPQVLWQDNGGDAQKWKLVLAPPAPGTVALRADYKFESADARDSSGKQQDGVLNGGVTFVSPGRVDASAASFDGTSGNIQIPAVVANDFTIAFWMRTSSTGGAGTQWYSGNGIVDGEVPGVAADFGTSLLGTKVAFGVGSPDTTIASTSAVNDGAWHHVTVTRNGTSGAMQLFVDGELQASATGPAGTRSAPTFLRIGSLRPGSGFFGGSLDEVRLYSYVLAPTEVTKLARVGNQVVASYDFENNALDSSGQGNHGAATTGGISYVTGRVGAQAAQFDGSSGSVKIPASVVTDLSISYWIKTTASAGAGQWWDGAGIVDGEVPGVANDFGTALLGNKAGFGVGNPDATITSASAINDGQWHHVASTRHSSNGAMSLYVDGALQATGMGPVGARNTPQALRIGGMQPGGGFLAGALDEVRLYNYPLTAGQVMAMVNPPPPPWVNTDVGSPAAEGYAGYNASTGSWAVGGSGSDIWQTSDQFNFVNQSLTGDGSLVTRVTSLPTNTDGTSTANAKAGLMFRASTAANAPFVDIVYDVGQGLQFINRPASGAQAVQPVGNVTGILPPFWLRLSRGGNAFEAWYSTVATPGANDWTLVGSTTVTLPSTALGGLAVCSHNNGYLNEATFDNFGFDPNDATVTSTAVESWRKQWFGSTTDSGNGTDSADPDGDGFTNFWERAFSLDPTTPSAASSWPTLGQADGNPTLTYRRSIGATDLTYQVLWSRDLKTWAPAGVTDAPISSDGETEQRTAQVPMSLGYPLFLHLQVTRSQ
jgi:hypothetical protein